jgi:Cystathionine beta-lyases/cystathionine gamma-synthases
LRCSAGTNGLLSGIKRIKTLHVRMKAHCENGAKIAHWLRKHPKIGKVYWPGFEDHPACSCKKTNA